MIDTKAREIELTLPSDRELAMTRLFQAPAQALFDVWTKPEYVRQWYAIRSTTMTVCEIDLRVGGAWRWVVTKPGGMEIAFSGTFLELDPPRRMRRTEQFEAMPGAECIVTLTFDEKDGMTTLISQMLFQNQLHRDICLKTGMEAGVKECYEKIDALLPGLL